MKSIKIMKYIYIVVITAFLLVACGGAKTITEQIDTVDRTTAPEPGPAPEIKLNKPTTFTLDNGLQVIVVENHKLPTVNTSLYFDYPTILEGDKAGLTSFFGDVMRAGTENYTKVELDEAIEFYGIDLGVGSRSIGFSTLKKHLPKAVDFMTEILFKPTFDNADVLDKLQKQAITALQASSKNPDAIMSRVSNALMYGTNHPWGEYQTEESIKNVTLADLQNHYNTYFKPNIAYLTIVGDVSVAEAKEIASANFSDWEKGSIPEFTYPEPKNVEQTVVNIVNLPTATQSNIYITNLENLQKSNEDYFAATLGDHVLGGSSFARLFLNLREDKGYTYGAYSNLGNDHRFLSRFNANAKVRNEVTDSSIMAFYDELQAITSNEISAESLQTAKNELTGRFALGLERPETIARFARTIFLEDLPSDFYANYLQEINSQSAVDILQAMQRYVKPDQQRIIIVGKAEDIAKDVKALGYPVSYFDIWGNKVSDPTVQANVSDVSAESILKEAIEAQGGENQLNTINSMKATYAATIPGLPKKATATTMATKDGKKETEIELEGMGTLVRMVFDGEDGFIEQMGQRIPMPEQQVQAMKLEHAFFPVLTLQKAEKLKVDNVVNVNNKPAYKVIATYPGDKEIIYYFDQESKFLVRASSETKVPTGQTVVSVQTFSDYKAYDGTTIPTKVVTESGPQTITMNLTDVKWNEVIPATKFE